MTPYERNTKRLFECHPELANVFSDLKNSAEYKPVRAPQPPGMTIKLLPFQLEGLHWLVSQEDSKYSGGVLADEMGMGRVLRTYSPPNE